MQDVRVTVAPSTARQGDEVTVAVSSGEPAGDWLLRVCESGGGVRMRPVRLDSCGEPAAGGGTATLECRIRTAGYGPGEYMVDVSPDEEFAPGRTVTRRLVVEAAEARPASRSGAWYLAPILLGLLGGIIAYVVVRHDDSRLAKNCLVIGIVITVMLWVLPVLLVLALPLAP